MNAVTEKPQSLQQDDKTSGAPPQVRRGWVKRWLRPVILMVVVAAVLVGAGWWFTEGRYIESTDNAYVQGDIAVLSPRIEGDIAAIPVADNQPVHAGDPLISWIRPTGRRGLPRPAPPPPRPTRRSARRSGRSASSRR